MYWHTMKTCALLLGLVMLAGAREGRPFPTHATSSLKSDCEGMVEDALGHQTESVSRALTYVLRQLENRITAMTDSMQLHEEQMTAAFKDILRWQDEKAATTLQEVMRQVGQLLQERDEAALRRALDERLQRLEEGKPSTPSPERAGGGLASWKQLERRLAGLEAACSSLLPLSTAQAPPATPSASTPPSTTTSTSTSSSSPSSSTSPSSSPSPSASTSERSTAAPAPPPASAPSAHDQQTERMRLEDRMKEAEARKKRARAHRSPLGETLCAAARDGSLGVVERLLDDGADVNYTSQEGQSPLIAASASFSYASAEVVSLLLKRGADVSAVDVYGNSALHWAAFRGNGPAVSLLLGAGADVDAREMYGATPLHYAAFLTDDEAARALLAGGARKDLKGWSDFFKGKTPLDIATIHSLQDLLRP